MRLILDYDAVLANESLVALDRTKHFAGDVLVTYLVNPGTALHIGVTEGLDNVRLDGRRSSPRAARTPRRVASSS